MKKYIIIFKNLLSIANKKIGTIICMFISSALMNISSLLPPIATSGIIAVLTEGNINGIWFYVILYIIFYILYFSSYHWNYYTYRVLAEYYHIEVQKKLYNHLAENETIFEQISKGKVIDTCNDDIRYLVDVVDEVVESVMGVFKLLIIACIFIFYSVPIAIFVVVLDFFYIILMNKNANKIAKYYEGTRKYDDQMGDILSQMIGNIKQIKSFNLMPKLNLNLDKSRKKWINEYEKKALAEVEHYAKIPYLVYIGKIGLYVILSFLVFYKKMTLDQLVLLISYFELIIESTDTLLESLLNLNNYGVRVNRIKTILDYENNHNIDFGDIENDYINGLVEFKNVTYKVKNKLILNKVSFKCYPNEINTIVGHSGSGKTTIINLLYRLVRLNSGEILIDKENIYNYSNKVYHSNISGVYQSPFIFNMSIKDNLSLVDKNKENQIEACKRVGIHDFIMSLPKGYNTILGEGQHEFSEGQKQLLAIARALLTKAEILLLDEITSNIDPAYTATIAEVVKDLKTDHTIIVVTHKTEMMDIADRIVVIDKGRIIAKGKNEDVFKRCSLYRDLKNRTFASISKE